ncbi:MAG: ATP-binding domain-containing protein [Nitrospirota bacterium]
MTLNQEQRVRLVELGEEILAALVAVSNAAASLERTSTTASAFQSETASRNLFAIQTEVRQSLQRLRQEPMVARVLVEWQGTEEAVEEVIYVCRASAAGLSSALQSGRLASYRAPVGRLAELAVGDYEVIELSRGNEREAHILERATFQPLRDGEGWDASNNDLAFRNWNRALISMRRFIREIGRAGISIDGKELIERVLAKAAEEEIVRNNIRRQTIDRIALRDQAILDAHQGEIFRLPINKRLVLFGPPGTGKTTTLIKRIAQKRTIDELGDDERQLVNNLDLDPTNWVMYSPTELLKLYLRDAFNKEGVPAGPSNLRTWESERHELGRNVLGIFRGTTGGRYVITMDNEILQNSTSPSLSRLHDEFSGYMINWVITRCEKALAQIQKLNDPEAAAAIERVRGIISSDSIIPNHIYTLARDRSLADEVRRLSQQASEKAHAMVGGHLDSEKLNALVALLPDLESRPAEGDDEDEDEEDDDQLSPSSSGQTEIEKQKRAIDMLRGAVRSQARASAQGNKVSAGSKASRVLDCLGDRVPLEQEYAKLGRLLVVRDGLRRLHRSARDLVFRVPTAYARFRREAMRENRWYLDDIQSLLSNNRISPAEVDMLILCMLRNARLVDAAVRDSPWLDVIRDRYAVHVYIDEATDFSAVELACMLELAHPKLRSWFACGDFRQRITWSGLTGPDELGWIQKQTGGFDIEKREIKRYYRQSPRLIALATELAKIQGFENQETEAPNSEFLNYSPLCAESLSDEALAKWLSGRIEEVERAVGHLPSIAIFVDGEERIDPLVERVGRYLQEHSLRIVGCKEGRVVGEAKEVRVFDVKHIKGLEFEAVFVVGIDHLAERLPELFDRYLYVAVSRAATYLGLTCEGKLPQRLESVRSQFSTGSWHA